MMQKQWRANDMKTKIIVRADDLGYSRAVNLGIADTVKHGIINNVGLMVNMPTTETCGLKSRRCRKKIDG